MSGGTLNHYDFRYRIDEDIDRIEDLIEKNPDDYNVGTIAMLKCMHDTIAKANVYLRRIDWLLSGDDGEDDLPVRLEEDLKGIKTYTSQDPL